jgi:chromosomal replication initiation ATPase DnaA
VHVLDRHAAAQEALLSLASRALTARSSSCLTSDDAAGASALAHRIVHRFRTGHSATLGIPDWAHRVAILHAKAAALAYRAFRERGASSRVARARGASASWKEVSRDCSRSPRSTARPLTLALARRACRRGRARRR